MGNSRKDVIAGSPESLRGDEAIYVPTTNKLRLFPFSVKAAMHRRQRDDSLMINFPSYKMEKGRL